MILAGCSLVCLSLFILRDCGDLRCRDHPYRSPRSLLSSPSHSAEKTERIVDESTHFLIVPAEPIERRGSWFKRSIHQLHWILACGHRSSEARQAIQSAGPGKDQME